MKVCQKCRLEKYKWEYYKEKGRPDGYSYICKECSKKRVRKWISKNRDRSRKYHSNYRKKNKNKFNQYRKNNIEKYRAREKLNYAVRKGLINRPEKCQTCLALCKPEAHHRNYSQPLSVIWLCKECHRKLGYK